MNRVATALALLLATTAGAQAAADPTAVPLPSPSPSPSPVSPGASRSAPATPPWEQLSDERRRERRAQYAAWRAMSEGERQRVREAAARFAALPPGTQQTLRGRFADQDQAFRDGWRLGPLLGEHFGRLQGMFGFVPEAQRTRTLAVLRQLTRAQLAQLTLVAQRTPPQQRDAVRTAFLAVAPGERDAWLARQVGR